MLKMWVGSRWWVHSLASSSSLMSASLLASVSLSSLLSSCDWSCSCSWLICSIDGRGAPAAATGANVVAAGGICCSTTWGCAARRTFGSCDCCCSCSRSCCTADCWRRSSCDCAGCGCDSGCFCCNSCRCWADGSQLYADVLGTLDDAAAKSSRRGFLAPPD